MSLKGKTLRCISHTYGAENDGVIFTPGKHYTVKAGEGDPDTLLGGVVNEGGAIVDSDTLGEAYVKVGRGYHGVFEVVE